MQTDRNELIALLLQSLAGGELREDDVVGALRSMASGSSEPYSRLRLIEVLRSCGGEELRRLRAELLELSLNDAAAVHEIRRSGGVVDPSVWSGKLDVPAAMRVGWTDHDSVPGQVEEFGRLLRDRNVLKACTNVPPELETESAAEAAAAGRKLEMSDLARFVIIPSPEMVPEAAQRVYAQQRSLFENRVVQTIAARQSPLPEDLQPGLVMQHIQRAYSSAQLQHRMLLLDSLLMWPGRTAAKVIVALCNEEWEQEHALLLLTQRFGKQGNGTWSDMRAWLVGESQKHDAWLATLNSIRTEFAAELVYDWYSRQPSSIELVERQLEAAALQRARDVDLEVYRQRRPAAAGIEWRPAPAMTIREPIRPPAVPPPISDMLPPLPVPPLPLDTEAEVDASVPQEFKTRLPFGKYGETAQARAKALAAAVSTSKPPEPEEPGFWKEHVQPFVTSNWYVVAGVLMAIAGAALLAYFTWDKHWLLRYTIMPSLLALFTCGVAGIARWIESREPTLQSTSSILRGAAIQLLPLNFIVVALLGRDPDVSGKVLVLPLVLAVYAGFFSWQMWRWITPVHAALRLPMTATIMAANLALAVAALSPVWSGGTGSGGWLVWGVMHAAFLVLAASAVYVAMRVLTPELVAQRQVPWFFGLSIGFAFAQAFAWGHGLAGRVPIPADYAVLAVLGGGLVLFTERRSILLSPSHHGYGESFIGFALILLGVLFGMGDPEVRVLTLAAAGVVWLTYADVTPGLLHYWIGLTAIMLSGAALALLPGFPQQADRNMVPFLGIAVAGLFGGIRVGARHFGRLRLSETAREFQPVVLFLAAVATVMSQWHVRSEPLHAGIALVIIAAIFGLRAHRVQRLHWVHTTMALLALSLPYLGFVDMRGRSAYGNTLVFGLALLSVGWIVWVRVRASAFLTQARSTVLWSYGILAVAAMLLRIVMEQGRPGEFIWYRFAMDYAGPILMSVALVITSYYSRSLIPSMMAVFILIVLFPELRAKFPHVYNRLQWGTGLGGAISALVCAAAAFPVRRAKFLQGLGEGDLFLGRVPFPMRRYDSTLFTIPLILSAMFLAGRVDTLVFWENLRQGGIGVTTAVALGLTGLTWITLPVFLRAFAASRVLLGIGWIEFFLCAWFLNDRLAAKPEMQTPFIALLLLMQCLVLLYTYAAERREWAVEHLLNPTRAGLAFLVTVGSVLVSWYCVTTGEIRTVDVLWVVIAAQLLYLGLSYRHYLFGTLLYGLLVCMLVTSTVGGRGPLREIFTFEDVLLPLTLLAAAVQIAQLLMEFRPKVYELLRPVMVPFQAGSSLLVLVLGIILAQQMILVPALVTNVPLAWMVLGVLLLTARANHLPVLIVPALLLGYLLVQIGELRSLANVDDRLWLLSSPWRTSVLAIVYVAAAAAGRELIARMRHLSAGLYPLVKDVRGPGEFSLLAACWWLGAQAALLHTMLPHWRNSEVQMAAPYIATTAYIISGFLVPSSLVFHGAAALATLGNVQLVNHAAGLRLRNLGVTGVHITCVGLLVTLVLTSLVRVGLRRENGSPLKRTVRYHSLSAANNTSIIAAALILLLLALNYFASSDLTQIPAGRFAVSGLLALIAGEYFRRAARNPSEAERPFAHWFESAYHFGLTIAIWCFALLIPALRTPATALIALGIPAVYFYLRAEAGALGGRIDASMVQYRNSATVLAFGLLALYATYSIFQMILFPRAPMNTNHYHYNAPTLLVVAVLMIRLHGLGGTWWLALYGVLALFMGTYFTVTWYPGLSPFHDPVPAAWAAIAIAHVAIIAAYQRSPLRHAVQLIGGISDDEWLNLRRNWGGFLIVAVHLLTILALRDYRADTYRIAPLLVGCASVLIHIGLLRNVAAYLLMAGVEILIALHADFIIPSYVPRASVIWILLGVWTAWLLAQEFLRNPARIEICGTVAAVLAVLVGAHIVYHYPWSNAGLWAFAFAALLAWGTPRYSVRAATGEQSFVAALLLGVPIWLTYFSQIRNPAASASGPMRLDWFGVWPVMTTALVGLAVAAFADAVQRGRAHAINHLMQNTGRPRVIHHTIGVCADAGNRIYIAALVAVTALSSAILVLHYGYAFTPAGLVILCVAWAACAVGWFHLGRRYRRMLPYLGAQFCVLGLFAVLRRQLMLTTSFWNYEFDVWVSIAVSCFLSGGKARIRERLPEAETSAAGALFVIPAVAMIWVLLHHLGTDIALVVIGVHSLLYAFLGREDRQSPFTMVAVAGFVAFVMLLFWAKLEFRVLHAYVIPVGLGVLAVLHLMGRNIPQATRERIRLVTLAAMLGSTGYHALVDARYPVWFHFTMLVLCLGAMGLGSFLRIRIYLILGFCGLVVDVASIVYKTIARLDSAYKMTSIGSLLLLLGVVVVTGSVYYKLHHERIEEQLNRLRARFSSWE